MHRLVSGNILVVDDDQNILDLLDESLSEEGYQVTTTTDSSQIMDLLKSNNFDSIISDINMPSLSGLELLELVKKFDENIPVILITGFSDMQKLMRAIKLGAYDYLKKPFHLSELLITVKQAVHKRTLVIENIEYQEHLEEMVQIRTKQLEEANRKIEENLLKTILAMVNALEASDEYTRGHSERVSAISIMIGREVGLTALQQKNLLLGAILHDIGKIGISYDLLNKPGALDEVERMVIQKHPMIGYNIIKPIDLDEEIFQIVLQHHEAHDGTGYPDAINKVEISLLAKIVAVSDVFDALTSDRAYRKALDQNKALEIMDDMADHHLDKDIIKTLKEVLNKFSPEKFEQEIKNKMIERVMA